MLMTGSGTPASVTVMLPLPEALTPPPRLVTVTAPNATPTVSLTKLSSSKAVKVRFATLSALALPVKVSVLVAAVKLMPVAVASAMLKSSPGSPPVKMSGTEMPSPAASARPSVTVNAAVALESPSVAVVSVTAKVTLVASSSATATCAEPLVEDGP